MGIFNLEQEYIPNPQSYSCISRLENKYLDLSYNNLKNHIKKSIKSIKKHYKNRNYSYSNYQKEFDLLKTYIDCDHNHIKSLKNGIKELCRYKDIKTYEHNHLEIYTEKKYINASPINIISDKYIIATQGPMNNTIEDFWEMIEQYDCNVIIMLCKVKEFGIEKCAKYWDPNYKLNKYTLLLISEKEKIFNYTVIQERKIKLINNSTKKEKNIIQYHYEGWLDGNIPDITRFFQVFIYIFEQTNKLKGDKPFVVHCSGGVGRTGTFIALYFLFKEILDQLKNKNLSIIDFSVFNMVRKIKEMRLLMVQNEKQYKFIYDFIKIKLLNLKS
jgi:protein tyrosine phosphatase